MLKLVSIVFGLIVMLAPSLASADAYEDGIDRPGGDYKVLNIPPPPPNGLVNIALECANDCFSDSQCQAWTLVSAGVQGPTARCWLKSSIPAPRPCPTCTSDVKNNLEAGIDRPGSDYKNFDMTVANPAACSSACSGEQQCTAWTYVNPGVQGPHPRCWLKNLIPVAKVNNCCTSGLTQAPPVVR